MLSISSLPRTVAVTILSLLLSLPIYSISGECSAAISYFMINGRFSEAWLATAISILLCWGSSTFIMTYLRDRASSRINKAIVAAVSIAWSIIIIALFIKKPFLEYAGYDNNTIAIFIAFIVGTCFLNIKIVFKDKQAEANSKNQLLETIRKFHAKMKLNISKLTSTFQKSQQLSSTDNLLLLAITLLFIAALMDFEYGFYVFLRITISFVAGIYLFLNIKDIENGFSFWNIIFLLVFILFNPLKPIPFQEETWTILDVLCACVISIRFYQIRKIRRR